MKTATGCGWCARDKKPSYYDTFSYEI